MPLIILSREEQLELLALRDVLDMRESRRAIDKFFSITGDNARWNYQKQLDFFRAGKDFHQRLFIAANRCGKSLSMGCELTYHLTGEYPAWWEGKRFESARARKPGPALTGCGKRFMLFIGFAPS